MRRKYTYKEMKEKERLIEAADELLKNLPKRPESWKQRQERITREREANKKKHVPYKLRKSGLIP